MIATGGTITEAVSFLKKRGVTKIKIMSLIVAVDGVKRVFEKHPDVMIYCCAMDEKLNSHAYIIPGLGDAGDRLFGTK